MNKLEELKTTIRNTPPERLAKVEYRSHFLQILGTIAVCSILVYKGYWYIIFAFIFSLGVSYSQGVSSYQKYNAIMEIRGNHYDPIKDKSPTRKRDYLIKKTFGSLFWFIVVLFSFFLTYLIVPTTRWYMKVSFAMVFLLIYLLLYFFLLYWVALLIERRGRINGINRNTNTKKHNRN